MKITVSGSGYVGLVTGACLSEMGNHVVCLDVDEHKIAVLQSGGLPIHEPGLLEMVTRNAQAGRLQFTTDVDHAVAHGTIQFIAVGTPPGEDGSADLQHVLQAARAIGERMTDYKVIVDKSTVPVGTADAVESAVNGALATRGVSIAFSVVSNPEFLKEGAAVDDFMRPDRVVIGADDERAVYLMRSVYSPFVRNRDRLLVMDRRSAELTKYAANAMLATRISFMNELANLAERLGADIELVRLGIGSDPRIGTQFLYAGCGYGGSCFPKDVKALVHTGAAAGMDLQVLRAVEAVNEAQKQTLVDKVVARFGSELAGRRFALWGLAFKPGTETHEDLRAEHVEDALEQVKPDGQHREGKKRRHTAAGQGPVIDLEHVERAGQSQHIDDARDPEQEDRDPLELLAQHLVAAMFRHRLCARSHDLPPPPGSIEIEKDPAGEPGRVSWRFRG